MTPWEPEFPDTGKKTGKKKKYFYNDKNGDKIKADNGNYENKLA